MTKTYVGDVGTEIRLETEASLAGATTLEIAARKPDGTEATWTATADGTVVRYFTEAGDLDQSGQWLLQAVVVTASGAWRGETAKLKVYPEYR